MEEPFRPVQEQLSCHFRYVVPPRHHFSALSLRLFSIHLDLQNEPNGIDASVIASQMQAAVNGIRAGGATNLILAEGTSWTGAWTWTSSGNAAAFVGFTDPANNFAIGKRNPLDSLFRPPAD